MDPVGIGLIGCGNISDAYLKALAGFECLKVLGLADLRPEAAQAKAAQHGLRACGIDELLRDDRVEIIVNLTIPAAHVAVGLQAVAAGKHVHSEKPLGLNVADARRLIDAAAARGELRPGVTPADLTEVITGIALLAALTRSDAPDDDWIDRNTTLILKGIGA